MKREEIRKQFELKLNNIEPSATLIEDTIRRAREKELNKKGYLPTVLKSCASIVLALGIATLAYFNNYGVHDIKINTITNSQNNIETNMMTNSQNNVEENKKSIEISEYKKVEQKVESIESQKENSMASKMQRSNEVSVPDEVVSNTLKAVPENALGIQSVDDSADNGFKSVELNNFALSKDSIDTEVTPEFKSMRSNTPIIIEVNIGDREEKIIDIYKDAKKEGDKYTVVNGEREITFTVKDGKVAEIILR